MARDDPQRLEDCLVVGRHVERIVAVFAHRVGAHVVFPRDKVARHADLSEK